MKLIKNKEWKEIEFDDALKEIPVGWEKKQINDLFFLSAGGDLDNKTFSKIKTEKHIFPVYSNSVSDKGIYGYSSKSNRVGDTITVTARGTLGVSFYREHDYVAIGRLLILTKKINLTNKFYEYYINSKINIHIEQTGVPQLTAPSFKEYYALFPSVNEQTSIASILSKQEQVITDTESLISKLEKRMKWFSNELLSGRLRVKEVNGKTVLYKNTDWKTVDVNGEDVGIPVDWEVSSFYNKLNFTNGCAFKPSEWSKSGTPIIRIQNLSNKEKEINYYSGNKKGIVAIKNGDFLFAWSGTIDIFKYEGPNAILNQHIFLLTKKEKNCIDYFVKCLKKHIRLMDAHGLGMKHITLEEIKRYHFAHSSSEIEQNSIAVIFAKQEEQIAQYKQQLKKEQQKFKWLLNNLLSGNFLIRDSK